MTTYLLGIDKNGNCCTNCDCAENCDTPELDYIFIRYTWYTPCKDLDTSVEWNDMINGWSCNFSNNNYSTCITEGVPRICWQGDDTEVGGSELHGIFFDFSQLNSIGVQRNGELWFHAKINATWFEPNWTDTCDGKFDLYITESSDIPNTTTNIPLYHKRFTGYTKKHNNCSNQRIANLYWNTRTVEFVYT